MKQLFYVSFTFGEILLILLKKQSFYIRNLFLQTCIITLEHWCDDLIVIILMSVKFICDIIAAEARPDGEPLQRAAERMPPLQHLSGLQKHSGKRTGSHLVTPGNIWSHLHSWRLLNSSPSQLLSQFISPHTGRTYGRHITGELLATLQVR